MAAGQSWCRQARYVPQLPDGWVKCPRFGDPRFFEGLNIIPCKVPLGRHFDQQTGASGRWTLADAIRQFRGYGMEIECRGRGESPRPAEVNEAVWHIFIHSVTPELQNKYILLHCTHGFNRTGFVIVSALMRLRKDRGLSDAYINDLFKYYHETREPRVLTPRVPAWKGNDDAEDAADAANEDAGTEEDGGAAAPPAKEIHHEDIWSIGERVCGLLRLDSGGRGGSLRFPGMQPVSLSLERMADLAAHRSPGRLRAPVCARHLRAAVQMEVRTHEQRRLQTALRHRAGPGGGGRPGQGTYIMDRSFNVVRCEMRFPCGNFHVEFPPGVDPLDYDGKLCECTFDRERGVWLFMRERKDKDTANGSRVYLRIKESIINHVDQDLLVGTLKDSLINRPEYASDRAHLGPAELEVLRRDVEAWRERQHMQYEQQQMQQHHPPPPGHGRGAGAGGAGQRGNGHAAAGGTYKVSDADDGARAALKRKRDPGDGEGGEGGHGEDGHGGVPRGRTTVWGPEIDEPHEHCPAYEGFGF
eukprot:XP_001694380.1 mRNA capping enzyme with dual 5' triphosphatase and guanylyltransferase activities [Chlamydomonas reinhardtii]